MTKAAFITGAEGFIGSYMVKFLQKKGWNVVAGYRLHSSNSFPKLLRVEFVQCDLTDGRRVEQLISNSG